MFRPENQLHILPFSCPAEKKKKKAKNYGPHDLDLSKSN
jgi:hypothetical protein